MKRLFNHRKRPYESKKVYDDYDEYDEWDDAAEESDVEIAEEFAFEEVDSDEMEYAEEIFSEEEYSEEEYSEDVYSEEDGWSEEAEYAEEASEDYVEEAAATLLYDAAEGDAEELAAGEYEEAYEGEDYGTDSFDSEGYEAEAYEETDYDDGVYYEEEYEDEEEDEEFVPVKHRKRASRGEAFGWFGSMGVMDRVIACTGLAVLLMAVIVGGIFVSGRMKDKQVDGFATVGSNLADIRLPGEKGLMAVADAQAAKKAAAEALKEQEEQAKREEEEKDKDYKEEEYKNLITVKMDMTSIKEDLKIKFSNKETGKLISNVPFAVTVTDASGKESVWTDDDMDGIIYKTKLSGGQFKVEANELSGAKYKNYSLPVGNQRVEVKKEIVYAKVEIKNEIKSEAEVDVKKEDTQINDTVVESTLTDTVTWVESTTTLVNYKEVLKSTIADPATVAFGGSFRRLAQIQFTPVGKISESTKNLKVGENFTLTASAEHVNLKNVSWSSSDPRVARVTGNGTQATVEALAAGNAIISYTAEGETVDSSVVSAGNAVSNLQASCQVIVAEAVKPAVSVDKASVETTVGGKATVKATAANFEQNRTLKYAVSADKADVAEAAVDDAGTVTVTGKAAGSAVITVTVNYAEGGTETTKATATFTVKVKGTPVVKLDQTAATVLIGTPITLQITLENATSGTLSAETADANIATVALTEKTVTVTGVAAGSTTLTVKYKENDTEVSAKCTLTVKLDPKNDKTNKLKDTGGRQIYVEENGSYREAVYADYYTAAKFFIKGEAKYTGWQTLNGRVYYFDGNGNKITGQQVIQGAAYDFGTDGALITGSGIRGIDVSKWNGSIDWEAVKNSGIEYVIIRCGYRGSSQGSLIEDPKYVTNIKGAINAGLKVGVYFFTQAITEAEAVEEASMVLEQVKNYKLTYPIFLDVEASGGRADKIDKATRTAVCKAFCETIQSAGYTAGIYANKNWLETKMDANALSSYRIWLAQYAATPTYGGRYDMWQYQSTGKVSGISGDVDMNWSYLNY